MNRTKNITRKMKIRFICTGLWILENLRRRGVKLQAISRPDALIFSGLPFSMHWQVSGCYKIVVNGRIRLPGTLTSVQLNPDQVPEVLEICFFGCDRQLVQRFPLHKKKLILEKIPVPIFPSFRLPAISLYQRPGFIPVKQLKTSQWQATLAISKPWEAMQVPVIPMLHVPLVNMQLEPYPLQPTQPEYETTVL